MTTLSSIARPYALAAFEIAREQKQLMEWKAFLSSAAMITRDPTVTKLLEDPERTSQELYELFDGVLATIMTTEQKNLLRLLAQNKRLLALPEIEDSYSSLLAALEKICTVRVVTAIKPSEDYELKLGKALATRTQSEVKLHCEVDPSIIGGAIIHIGDRVIDGSVRGKLNRLLENSLR